MKVIKFKRMTAFTEYNPKTGKTETVQKPTDEEAPYSPEKEEEVKKASINGEYIVEEIPDSPHEPDVWDEMAEAYRKGVNRA